MDVSSATSPVPFDPKTAFGSTDLLAILGKLSQELSRPLVSLRAGLELLLGDTADPINASQRSHVQTMVAICDNVLETTRCYVDFASIVHGTRPLSLGWFTLGALIRDLDRQFAAKAAGRHLEWACGIDGDDGTVVTDVTRCQRVFGNLVQNAIGNTPAGGRVEVRARIEGDRWSLSVRDTGRGIPSHSIERVFEPCFQLPDDGQAVTGGNGLGLAICRAIAEHQLGGAIQLSSVSGEGTLVKVVFPTRLDGRPI